MNDLSHTPNPYSYYSNNKYMIEIKNIVNYVGKSLYQGIEDYTRFRFKVFRLLFNFFRMSRIKLEKNNLF